MALGDQTDIQRRLTSLLPRGWFADDAPVLSTFLQGFAASLNFAFNLLSEVRRQSRIKTATGASLDLIAWDFLGPRLLRKPNQTDAAFRAQILASVLRPRSTRQAIIQALTDLTQRTPGLVEVWRPADVGAYGVAGLAYSVAGTYGSLALANTVFVTAFRPKGDSFSGLGGYRTVGGYCSGTLAYGQASLITSGITDQDIYAAVESVRPVSTTLWVAISS